MSRSNQQQPSETDVAAMLVNPFYAVTFSDDLFGEHQPMVSEDQWIAANTRLINELGAERYLRQLLTVLKGDFPRQPDDSLDE